MPGILRGPKSRVQRLEIENFKSYRGRQEVGPFHAFTAVIGPNGSGKSNIMDAVSFVLGVKGAQLRGSLKELLYSYTEGQQAVRPESGYVKLVLETDGQDDTSFQRTIVMGRSFDTYTSQYAINERTVSWAAYEEKLKTFGILVKARNFLVFQGDIEAVASKQPLELTKLLESISGSDTYKADYEKFDADKQAAQEKLNFIQSKKKNTAAEKRQKKEQKVEAERHLKLQEQLENLKSKYYLWQLYHSQLDAETTSEELESKQAEFNRAATLMQGDDATLKDRKKEIAGLKKQRIDLDQKAKKRQAEAAKSDPEQTKVKLEVKRTLEKIQVQETKLADKKAQQQSSQGKIQEAQKKLAALQKEKKKQEAAPAQNKLSEEHFLAYQKCEEKVKSKTSRARGEIETLQGFQETDLRTLHEAESDIARIEKQLDKLHADAEAQKHSQAEQERTLQALHAELKAKEERLTNFSFESRRISGEKRRVEEKIRRTEEKSQEYKALEKQSRREMKAQEVIGEMKEVYRGVFGRLSDLSKVTQQSYSLALALAMGKDLDSVVVDNEATAKDCIAFLKQKREPPMTFIPLATVKAHRPHERLRALGGTAKLAIDLLEFDPKLEKAFNSACGNTLVCDDEAEARHLGFGSTNGDRHKVVTKGGLLIAKAGAMTGGGSGDAAAKAARFDQARLQQLKQEKQQYESQLRALPDDQSQRKEQTQLQHQVGLLKARIQALDAAVKKRQEGGTGVVQAAEPLLEQKQLRLSAVEKARREIEERQKKIDDVQERINNIEDDIYAPLGKAAGIENLRIFLNQNKGQVEKHSADMKKITIDMLKMQQQLSYEQSHDYDKDLASMEEALQKHKDRLSELEQQTEKIERAKATLESKAASEADSLEGLKQKIEEGTAEVKELQSKSSQQLAISHKLLQETTTLRDMLAAFAVKQSEILQAAQMEQVELPRDDEEAEGMETDNPAADTASAVAALSFDSLSRQHKARLDKAAREQLDSEFAASIEEQQSALAKMLPNLKAVEQYEEAKEKDDKEKAELEQARQLHRETANAFHAVRQQRADAYMKAFDHIKDVINPIYKDLTKSSGHPMGGTAYLSMTSSEDEPFLSGVNFTAMPPSKRWRQMEALSGGEKTVAALALLFAIHSFHPSPFFVLDEVDAALDASNVAKVATYIRERTRTEEGKEHFQAIVISLKDYFFSKADAIVGVTKHPHHGCSQTFTLDLNQYGQPEQ